MNSALFCLWLVATSTGCEHVLPEALRGSPVGRLNARQLLGFHSLGWSRPERQHDVCEFIAFLFPKLAVAVITGRVDLRQILLEGMQIRADNSLQQCIILPDMPRRSLELQDLLNFWHQQNDMRALTCTDPWIFVQLPRFAWHRGRAKKTTQSYHITDKFQVPVYADEHSLLVRWESYSIKGIIQHHGHSPAAGHYTVIQTGAQQHWVIDDEKEPRALESDMHKHVCANMYVLALTCDSCQALSSSSEPHSVSVNHAPADLCANQRSPQGRNGLACSTALSSGVPAATDCSGHGHTESNLPRSLSQTADDGAASASAALPGWQQQVQATAAGGVV